MSSELNATCSEHIASLMAENYGIVWFRQDLRVHDNPALHEALAEGLVPLPFYVLPAQDAGDFTPGAASRWWLNYSLLQLQKNLKALRLQLILRRGNTVEELQEIAKNSGARALFYNRRYEPAAIQEQKAVEDALAADGLSCHSFNGCLLIEPWDLETSTGGPYKVYTPYSKAAFKHLQQLQPCPPREDEKQPKALGTGNFTSLKLEELALLPKIRWDAGLEKRWLPGEQSALQRLEHVVESVASDYDETRNLPDIDGTSALSPHLHFGEISPRHVWCTLREKLARVRSETARQGLFTLQKELLWREFANHLIYHFPHTTVKPLNPAYSRMPYRKEKRALQAWQKGQTGYPIVDAGLRQLWETGWMHNRVRLITASFLVKHLLIDWREGAAWFWDTLVDADLANNTMNWQWIAGSGADASPYYRIFNPVTQGEKFDPEGNYVRRFVPELKDVPARYIHQPWEAPAEVLAQAGVELGKTYPRPIVDHQEARERALGAYAAVKSKS